MSLLNTGVCDSLDFVTPGAMNAGLFRAPLAAPNAVVPRIVLFDDDPLFSRSVERVARRSSIPLSYSF